ncbi:MAG TPA: hypothetical protein VFZ65_01480 [Planctomycetota bacterium]|nr:hypothetical protein [Planctomycetota bacterium]
MSDPRAKLADDREAPNGGDSHAPAAQPSPESALPREDLLLAKLFWTVPEAAFLMRVGVRTVWRLMADPKSKFPKPRRIRGRTLLARDEALAFLNGRGGSAK